MAQSLITKEERDLNRVSTLSITSVRDSLASCGSRCDPAGSNATPSPDLIQRNRLIQVGGLSIRQPSRVLYKCHGRKKKMGALLWTRGDWREMTVKCSLWF